MAAGAPLTIRVTLKDDFSRGLAKLHGFVAGESGRIGKAFGTITRSVFNLRNAIVAGIGGVVVKDLLQSFAEQEAAVAQFNDALKRGGKFTEEYASRLHQVAAGLQAVGTQGDDAILGASKLLAMSARIGQETMPRAMKASVDLAAALGIDLGTAARLVTNAAEGMTSTFSRYGIHIDEAVAKSGDMNRILKEIERSVGGADAALAQTTTGSMRQIGNLFGDLKETAGEFLATIFQSGLGEFIKITLDELNRVLKDLVGDFKSNKDSAKAWADALIVGLKGVGYVVAGVIDGARLLISLFREGHLLALKLASGFVGLQESGSGFGKMLALANPAMAMQSRLMQEMAKSGVSVKDAIEKDIAALEAQIAKTRTAGSAVEGWGKVLDNVNTRMQVNAAVVDAAAKKQADINQLWDEANKRLRILGATAPEAIAKFQAVASAQATAAGDLDFERREAELRSKFAASTTAMEEEFKRFREASESSWAQYWDNVADGAEMWEAAMLRTVENVSGGVANIVGNTLDQILKGEITTTKALGKALQEMFADLARQILVDLVKMTVQMAIMAALKSTIGAAAKGAVWEGGWTPVQAFAQGGIVTRPTVGIVGEAGQNEAVVPLPDGRRIPVDLGGMGGGKSPVTVNLNVSAMDGPSVAATFARPEAQQMIVGAITDAQRRNERFRKAMRR